MSYEHPDLPVTPMNVDTEIHPSAVCETDFIMLSLCCLSQKQYIYYIWVHKL